MAKIVLGIGLPHSPLAALTPERWGERGADDMKNQRLNTIDGNYISYDVLRERVGDHYADRATIETFTKQSQELQAAYDRLIGEIEDAKPDVMIVIGDDHEELFALSNMPAFSIFYGKDVTSGVFSYGEGIPWVAEVAAGYAMDKKRTFPGAPEFAWALIKELIEQDVDVGAASKVPDSSPIGMGGFGHAYTFVAHRLFRKRTIPMVPVLLNAYYEPNAPTPKRCYEIGRRLHAAVEAIGGDARVAIVASGGLSHFITEEDLDRKLLKALETRDAGALTSIPVGALNGGSCEIRNWILAAGALEDLRVKWSQYIPVYRTPAGTGVGMGVAVWGASA